MAIPFRSDFDAAHVRLEAKRSKDGAQARRLLALAAIYDGATRPEAAVIGSVTVQIVRDWMVKFNEHGPAGLIDRKSPGQITSESTVLRAGIISSSDKQGCVATPDELIRPGS